MADLANRYAEVVEAVEASEGWVISVRASSPPLTLLGSLDGVEAGLRQLRRTRPLEVETVTVDARHSVRVPTLPEMLRIKAYLVVQRNAVRDYLDTVALADRLGRGEAAAVLGENRRLLRRPVGPGRLGAHRARRPPVATASQGRAHDDSAVGLQGTESDLARLVNGGAGVRGLADALLTLVQERS